MSYRVEANRDLWARARAWIADDPDPDTRAELGDILQREDESALADRFAAPLEFGTAGLRGELGSGPGRMNRAVVRRTTAGLAAYLRDRGGDTVVIGYDARHASDTFASEAASVLAGAGLRALVLPRAQPTPVLAFAVRNLEADAGVMITASHNPRRDNGYKVYLGGGSLIAPPVDAEIAGEIERVGPLSEVPLGTDWRTLSEEVVHAYVDALGALPLGEALDISVTYTPLHGVGRDVLAAAFARAGFPAPAVVREQGEPDPDFPTAAFPNPEEPGAMDLALAAGADADLVLANDPDADRCAVAEGGRVLTGDEVGCLLGEHVLARTTGPDRVVATTIVSSSMLAKIAADYGAGHAETLTGFKWLMGVPGRLVFAYEEALGYCVGADAGLPVRDKDGIGAALTVAGMAARARRHGHSLHDLLDDQARRYGVHATGQTSVRVSDPGEIGRALRGLRAHPPSEIGQREVVSAEDLAAGVGDLPPTEGMRYRLEGDAWIVVRPSGTEPKLKAYAEVVEPVVEPPSGSVAAARARAADGLAELRAAIPALTDLASG